MYKFPVEVNHPQDFLQGWVVGRWRKSSDGGRHTYGEEQTQSWRLNVQDTQLRSSKNTLLQVDGEAVEEADVENMAEVKLMIS